LLALLFAALYTSHVAAEKAEIEGTPRSFFGMNTGSFWGQVMRAYYTGIPKEPGMDAPTHMNLIAKSGITYLRSMIDWARCERTPGVYDWKWADSTIHATASRGMYTLALLFGTPKWQGAKYTVHTLPLDHNRFARFAAAFARRYGPGGKFWAERKGLPVRPVVLFEVWNEANFDEFAHHGTRNPGLFAKLLVTTARSLKGVNKNAQVVMGGLFPGSGARATDPRPFLKATMKAAPELKNLLSGVGYHPYGTDGAHSMARTKSLRKTMNQVGLSKKQLYLTEFGWLGRPSLAKQGANMRQFMKLVKKYRTKYGIAQVHPFEWWAKPIRMANGGIFDMAQWGIMCNPNAQLTPNGKAYVASIKN